MSSNADGSFTVTLADVYSEVRKLADQVGTMAPQAGTISDHEARLRALERWRYTVPAGLATAIAAIITAIIEHR